MLNQPGSHLNLDLSVLLEDESGAVEDLELLQQADESDRSEGSQDQVKKDLQKNQLLQEHELTTINSLLLLVVSYLLDKQASMPQVILYDSACKLLAHTYKSTAEERDRFTESIVAVDAFHLKSNREDDCFCRKWTDPNLSPQLKKDGSWIFNSSAAEIANIWYGGFASICRNMTAIQYNFFLDEMVWLHNIRMCAIKNNGIKIGSLNQLCDVDCITSSSGYL
ncbi:hypothetical protein PSHT_03275 [Puccinia striiformis]|uniref:Uncharacterized protein n=1 Tax=Puccinia striiformis TaxID=27350 RepID=A0A2S4WG18_9BASI|nr:hypothetical protein PSHT_03275 [Puccinia striiformis]